MILLNYLVVLVLVAIACVEGLAGTENHNLESFLKIILKFKRIKVLKFEFRNILISLNNFWN